jgi:proteasome lid subunit RPN8/RPN11
MDAKSIRLIIPLEIYQKLMMYVKGCSTEITGFADVKYSSRRDALVVGETYLLDQEAAAAEVEMSEEAIGRFNDQMMELGMEQLPRLWWHSHVKMGAFFSSTDEQAMKDLNNGEWSVALVLNHYGEMKATLNVYAPVYEQYDDIEVQIDFAIDDITDAVKQEIAEKVKPMKQQQFQYNKPIKIGKKNKKKGSWVKIGDMWMSPEDARAYQEVQSTLDALENEKEITEKVNKRLDFTKDQFYNGHNVTKCKAGMLNCGICKDYFDMLTDYYDEEGRAKN